MLRIALVLAGCALLAGRVASQTIVAPFDAKYSFRSLGSIPGVPLNYGGVTFKHDDLDVLLIGGSAANLNGALYAIRVKRAPNGAIVGFEGTATRHASAPNVDGGVQFGPNHVIFFTRYRNSELGQIKLGSTAPDKVLALNAAAGWTGGSPGSLSFVPPGYPGAGRLKICSWSGGAFHDCTLAPDGRGTFDLVGLQQRAALPGGPEGLIYPPPGSPLIPDYSKLIVNEFSSGKVVLYDVDKNGDPVVGSRVEFMTGLTGVEGAAIDARTGGFVFSTYGSANQLIIIDGFGACGTFTSYGTGIPGAGGLQPNLRGTGCATFGRAIAFQVGNGPAGGTGALNVGFVQTSVPILSGFVLTPPTIPIFHMLDATGSWTTTLNTPNDPNLVDRHVFLQAAYVDPGAPFGVAASDGLDVLVK
jgi:hypothetical protein